MCKQGWNLLLGYFIGLMENPRANPERYHLIIHLKQCEGSVKAPREEFVSLTAADQHFTKTFHI